MLERETDDVEILDAMARKQISRLENGDITPRDVFGGDKGDYIKCAESNLNKYRPSEQRSIPLTNGPSLFGPQRSIYRSNAFDSGYYNSFDSIHKRITTAIYRAENTEEEEANKVTVMDVELESPQMEETQAGVPRKRSPFDADFEDQEYQPSSKYGVITKDSGVSFNKIGNQFKKELVASLLGACVRVASGAVATWARDNKVPYEML